MKTAKVNLTGKPTWAVDPVGKMELADTLHDGVIESAGEDPVLSRRPGLKLFCECPVPGKAQGVFWWEKAEKLVFAAGGRIWHYSDLGSPDACYGSPLLSAGGPAVFCEGQQLDASPILYVCNGGKMAYSTSKNFTHRSSPAPVKVESIAYINGRFIANEAGTNRVYFTDVNPATSLLDPTYWGAPENPLTAENKPDNVTGIFSGWNELAVWGPDGMESWQDDGVTPFSPIPGAFVEAGLLAPASVVQADNAYIALCSLDGIRAVIRLEGRVPKIISADIAPELQKLVSVSDAIGQVISVDGLVFYALTFPSDDITWVYDLQNNYWSRWGKWSNLNVAPGVPNLPYNQFMGRFGCYAAGLGKYIVQDRFGNLYELSRNYYDDDGDRIRTMRRTGWMDHGVLQRKVCSSMRVRVKRGMGDETGNEPSLLLRYRTDGSENWSSYRNVSLGKQGDYRNFSRLHQLGIYRTRQYEIALDEPVELKLSGAEVDVEALGQ